MSVGLSMGLAPPAGKEFYVGWWALCNL